MTIGSLKCFRCDKLNCKKYYKCVNCDVLCCDNCLNGTNPLRLKYRVLKDDENGIEKTIYCPLHCSKTYKCCNDCGGFFSSLSTCSSCLINFCSECHDRNIENLGELMIPGDTEYNRQIKTISSLYCSKNCFLKHYLDNYQDYTICYNCGDMFVDYYGHGDCQKCLTLARVECDVAYDKNRIIYQKEILLLISDNKITEEEIIHKVNENMKKEILKNDFVKENKVTFDKWLYSEGDGAATCMTLYDNCILKIFEEYGIKVPTIKDDKIANLIEHIS